MSNEEKIVELLEAILERVDEIEKQALEISDLKDVTDYILLKILEN
ncbi:hypothetical protein [Sinanaerobacter chloroacetimidivorans]|uniref:Uncharacterized protein n=1 Tax=Sinanaerobacter chloroacetimidivorans TaxID=2818044 RepID=A0A8J8B3D8_9FIRM|nr:hypothetical protein [Sinanaerobacter chloroacetimidivorans]MBR0598210.1 hypothetical protein [Sinanaerobacter chloroacetimidivorans]